MATIELDDGTTLTMGESHGFQVGDTITIAGVPKPSLWRRLLIWLKLAEPPPRTVFKIAAVYPPPFKSFAMYRKAPSDDKWRFWAGGFDRAWIAKNGMAGVTEAGVQWKMEGRHYG